MKILVGTSNRLRNHFSGHPNFSLENRTRLTLKITRRMAIKPLLMRNGLKPLTENLPTLKLTIVDNRSISKRSSSSNILILISNRPRNQHRLRTTQTKLFRPKFKARRSLFTLSINQSKSKPIITTFDSKVGKIRKMAKKSLSLIHQIITVTNRIQVV